MALYLADSSIWSWAAEGERPDLEAKLAERFGRGEIVTCPPVVLEVMHRVGGGAEYEALYGELFDPLLEIPLSADGGERAKGVQRGLAGSAAESHRLPATDFLIAACAETHETPITLWFFDRDLEMICAYTGQSHEAES